MLTRSDLIDRMADEAKISKREASVALAVVLETIVTVVQSGDRFALTGFGTFERAHRPARQARNPLNGKTIEVAERYLPKFRPGKTFKDAMPAIKPAITPAKAKKKA